MKPHRPPRALPSVPTSTALVPLSHEPAPPGIFTLRPDLAEQAKRYAAAARAQNTVRARRADWQIFTDWCATYGLVAMPASVETVIGFILDQKGLQKSVATVHRYIATLSSVHRLQGQPNPCVDQRCSEMLGGVRRTHGVKQKLAAPITPEILTLLQPHCDVRAWALICFGQATACRRSEICALNLEDLKLEARGVQVNIRYSKTDQEHVGRIIGVPRRADMCPVAALERWLREVRRTTGPLFVSLKRNRALSGTRLSAHSLNAVVQTVVTAAGLNPKEYSGHSLRAGYVTAARQAGQSWEEIKRQTGHKRLEILEGYARYQPDPFTPLPR